MIYENDGSPLQGPSWGTAGQGTVRASFRFFLYTFTLPITWTIVLVRDAKALKNFVAGGEKYQKICVQVIQHHRNRGGCPSGGGGGLPEPSKSVMKI